MLDQQGEQAMATKKAATKTAKKTATKKK